MPRPNITRFTNLAIDPSLDDGNPYKIMRCPCITTEEINKIPEDGLKGGEIVYNTETENFQFYNVVWNIHKNTTEEILYGYVTDVYTTNLTSVDHVKFNNVFFSKGQNISLDTTSPYTINTNVDSIGRILLQPGRTYRLIGSLNGSAADTNGDNNTSRWRNADTGGALGVKASAAAALNVIGPSSVVVGYITPQTPTRVELRLIGDVPTGIGGDTEIGGGAFFFIEAI